MSGLWTPGGEHPVPPPGATAPASAPPGRDQEPSDQEPSDQEPSDEEIAALRRQLAETPAAVVVMNHCLGLWELAALHLSWQPPQLDQATVAIDALGAVVDRLEGRLGDDEPTVRDALAQLRLAFVQVKNAATPNGTGNDA